MKKKKDMNPWEFCMSPGCGNEKRGQTDWWRKRNFPYCPKCLEEEGGPPTVERGSSLYALLDFKWTGYRWTHPDKLERLTMLELYALCAYRKCPHSSFKDVMIGWLRMNGLPRMGVPKLGKNLKCPVCRSYVGLSDNFSILEGRLMKERPEVLRTLEEYPEWLKMKGLRKGGKKKRQTLTSSSSTET